MSKKIIVLHTLSAYNSYSSAIKFTRLIPRYAEAYENLSIDPAPCPKNPIKNKIVILNCQPLPLGENYTEKSVTAKLWTI